MNCIAQRFHCHGLVLKLGHAEEISHRSQSEDEIVVFKLMTMALRTVDDGHGFRDEVNALDFPMKKLTVAQQLPERVDDVCHVEIASRDLMQHRSEEGEVLPINQGLLHVAFTGERSFQPERSKRSP